MLRFDEKEKNNINFRIISIFLASISVMIWGFRVFYMSTEFPWMAIVSVLIILMSVASIAIIVLRHTKACWIETIEWGLLVCSLIGFGVWTYIQILNNPSYGTDELAFDQYAFYLVMHHINPYISSMKPAFEMYHVSPIGYTFTYSGTPVTTLSYPALSFLLYAPLWVVGIHVQNAVWTNVLFWAISMVMVFIVLKKNYRILAIVLFSWSFYVGFMEGGITDALMIPFLILTAFGWDRFAKEFKRTWWVPISFGLAMSIKQTPWFIAPFLVISLYIECQKLGYSRNKSIKILLLYIVLAFISFIVPNIVFIFLNPAAWIRGILTPLFSNIVPSGQGIVAFSVFNHFGGGNLSLLSYGSLLIYLGLLVVYTLHYPKFKPWTFFIPSILFLFTTRSFASYFADLLPVVLVSLFNYHPTQPTELSKKTIRLIRRISVYSIMPGCILVILAFRLTGPLHIQIDNIHTTGQYATIDSVTLNVQNDSSHKVTPHFTMDTGGQYTTFWNIVSGDQTILPYHTEKIVLQAPNVESMPPITGGFQVVGFTEHPYSVSPSKSYHPALWHVILTPEAIDRQITLGKKVVLIAKVVNRVNQPIKISNIPVYLGQVIYGQSGLEFAQTKINHGAIGQTPIKALTNSQGEAIFNIDSAVASKDPVYYEANLINSKSFYPYGYSNTVSILFK
ncbi:hypothetical protein [Alicyclobacillus tolerans]|uniref:Membrane protein n=1 Tax=Alicyclobacillus tolerans TaxID=90970 RepID=A0ABT9LZ81_9BACL|nr:hypothetical protein [Alicyclobacillus tengchongensis]MDP9729556.1 putative membrane protein [Alicyclobacillus tengchongensis]